MPDNQEIISSIEGTIGRIHLNNPKALNSLSLGMCQSMLDLLNRWRDENLINAIVVTSEGERAFCAGGDVREVSNVGQKDAVAARRFFEIEYTLDTVIAEFPKPFICLIDGIVMGGGLGISVNGAYRVMGDNIMAAMPETGIGLLPDVGATKFLNACPGRIGLYLGLTGARLDTADSLYAGFGTHFVPSINHPDLLKALTTTNFDGDRFAAVDAILGEFTAYPGKSILQEQQVDVDRLFAASDMETIITTLKNDESELAANSLIALYKMSPTSLKVTARQITENSEISLRDALVLEYRLVSQVLMRHDFYEGIRAALIDKDRKPQWTPGALAEVTTNYIDEHFGSLGDQELIIN
ncbi:MAG: Short-chain-enoyl-CoA hydratase [Alphaproteobacteria bacterium MarineAlpha11_Bin1]|nr:MAG: Short-chain-enoyl-CoA hydratase [Alphaproteobacteria bacterium MarineAlpha11_Bin1]|tara:strand:+ start:4918 stop:5979 length:1062 start_codon:yes stop_codon:yes gene_type:complete